MNELNPELVIDILIQKIALLQKENAYLIAHNEQLAYSNNELKEKCKNCNIQEEQE